MIERLGMVKGVQDTTRDVPTRDVPTLRRADLPVLSDDAACVLHRIVARLAAQQDPKEGGRRAA